MEPLIDRVRAKIEETLHDPNAETELELSPIGRIHGSIVSSAFNQMEHPDRQSLVREPLRRSLSKPEFLNVGVILMYTPNELRVMQEA